MSVSPVVAFGQSAIIESKHPIFISTEAWKYLAASSGGWTADNGLTIKTCCDQYHAKEWHVKKREKVFILEEQCSKAPYDLIKEALIQLSTIVESVSLSGFETYPPKSVSQSSTIVAFGPVTETPKIATTVFISKQAWNFVGSRDPRSWTAKNGLTLRMSDSSNWQFCPATSSEGPVFWFHSSCQDVPTVLEKVGDCVANETFEKSGVTFAQLSEALTEFAAVVRETTKFETSKLANLTCL
jgi:hypothetical protein